MSKVGSDGKAIFRADGKVMKPETYSEPNLRPILERDFSLYKENEILKELAAISKQETEDVIVAKIKSKLKIFDRFLFWLDIKIENRLKKKIEVKFPVTVDGRVIVKVYDEEYAV